MNPAFFLDKDGTLVDNSEFPSIIPADKLLRECILEGLREIQKKGYKLIIISNQPWISKGKMTPEEVENNFRSVVGQLAKEGVYIDAYYYCPHQTSDNCECKKPKGKMILQAALENKIDLENSYMVGDGEIDIGAGKNAGVKTILVRTGLGKDYNSPLEPDIIVQDINAITREALK